MLVRSASTFKCGGQTKWWSNYWECCIWKFLAWQETAVIFHVYVWVFCLHITLCIICVYGAQGDQKMASHPLELALQMAAIKSPGGTLQMAALWVLRIELGSSGSTTSALNHWTISSALRVQSWRFKLFSISTTSYIMKLKLQTLQQFSFTFPAPGIINILSSVSINFNYSI